MVNGKWYAYGTPWCGKDGINQNKKVPLAGICFLKQAENNALSMLPTKEAIKRLVSQTQWRMWKAENVEQLLSHIEKLVCSIPVFQLENRPETAAAIMSYEGMRRKAEEIGL